MKSDYTRAITQLEELIRDYSLPCMWSCSTYNAGFEELELHIFGSEGSLERYNDYIGWVINYRKTTGDTGLIIPVHSEFLPSDTRFDIKLWYPNGKLKIIPSDDYQATNKVKIPPPVTDISQIFYKFSQNGRVDNITALPNSDGTLYYIALSDLFIGDNSLLDEIVELLSIKELYQDTTPMGDSHFRFRKRKSFHQNILIGFLLDRLKSGL